MEYINYIKAELMILIPVLYGIGVWIKAIPKIKSYYIPFILLAISIPLTLLYLLGINDFYITEDLIITGIFQGIFIALTTVGTNQLYKQYKESVNDVDKRNDKRK